MMIARRRTSHGLAAALAAGLLAATAAAVAPRPALGQEAEQAEAQTIVVHLGDFTNDLHSAFMALSLGQNLAERGASVTLFLDREAVRLADARERGDLAWGDTGGVAAALDGFVAAGGKVVLCPHCAALGGVDPAQLRAGATVATHEEVADVFLSADKVIDF